MELFFLTYLNHRFYLQTLLSFSDVYPGSPHCIFSSVNLLSFSPLLPLFFSVVFLSSYSLSGGLMNKEEIEPIHMNSPLPPSCPILKF